MTEFLKAELKGKTLVDLGSGYKENRYMVDVANTTGVKTLLRVDPNLRDDAGEEITEHGTRVIDVPDFMLTTLMHVPTEQEGLVISINGIDKVVLDSDYNHALIALEAARALPVGGVIFGMGSHIFEMIDLEKFGFEEISFEDTPISERNQHPWNKKGARENAYRKVESWEVIQRKLMLFIHNLRR